MCDFSGRLVAWMDGELGANEAAEVEQHVAGLRGMPRMQVSAYEERKPRIRSLLHRDHADGVRQSRIANFRAGCPSSLPPLRQPCNRVARIAAALRQTGSGSSAGGGGSVRLTVAGTCYQADQASSTSDTLPLTERPRARIGQWLSPPSRSPSPPTRCSLPALCPRESPTSRT